MLTRGAAQVLSRTVRDENLRSWFAHIGAEIERLGPERPVSTGRKIQQLVAALEEVEQFHQARARPRWRSCSIVRKSNAVCLCVCGRRWT